MSVCVCIHGICACVSADTHAQMHGCRGQRRRIAVISLTPGLIPLPVILNELPGSTPHRSGLTGVG